MDLFQNDKLIMQRLGKVFVIIFTFFALQNVHAQCSTVPVKEAVRNGDFEAGYLSGSGSKHSSTAGGPFDFYSDMDFKGQQFSSPANGCHYGMGDGYVVARADTFTCASSDWKGYTHWGMSYGGDKNFKDHTPGKNGNGYALLVDLHNRKSSSKTGGLPIAWEQKVDIFPSESYWFSAWVANFSNGTAPIMQVTIIPENGGVVDNANIVTLPTVGAPTGLMQWSQMTASWTPVGIYDKVTIRFEFVNVAGGSSGLDVAIDDISFINSCQNIASQNTYTADFNLPDTINLCELNGSQLLDPQVPVGQRGNATITWYEGTGNPQTQTDAGIWTKNVSSPGTYRVCVDDPDNGCPVSDVVTVIEQNSINIADIELCNPAEVDLDAGLNIPNGAMSSISWSGPSGNSNTRTYKVTTPGAHSVTITASGSNPGCGAVDNFNVTSKLPTAPTGLEYCSGGGVNVNLSVGDGKSYKWATDQAMTNVIGTGSTPVVYNIPNGTTGDLTVWLQSAETTPLGTGGPTAGGLSSYPAGVKNLTFTTTQAVELTSLAVNHATWVGACGGAGTTSNAATISISGPVNYNAKPTLNCGSSTTVNLGWVLPAGTYTLTSTQEFRFAGNPGTTSIGGGVVNITSTGQTMFGALTFAKSEACEPIPVTIKEKNCCTAPTDDPKMDFVASDTSVCDPLKGKLVVPGLTNGLDYRWESSVDNGTTWNSVGADAVVAGGQVTLDPISTNGLYRLKLANTGDLDKSCIKISDTAIVVIKPKPDKPTITIDPNKTTFCVGEAHTLEALSTVTGGGTVTYTWSNAVTDTKQKIDGLTTQGTHTYKVVAESRGCKDSLEQIITVDPLEKATLLSDSDTVCIASGNVDLTAYENGSDAGTWSGAGVTGTSFDPNTATAGKHKINFTTNGTCTAKDSIYLIVRPKLDADVLTADTTFCKADVKFQVRLSGTSTTGGTWSGTGVSATGEFDATGLAAGDYYAKYVVTGFAAACSDSDSVKVTINPLDTAKITSAPSVCNSDAAFQMTLDQALTTTGTWTDSLGTNTYITTGGMFDPAYGGGLPNGKIKVYFTTNGSCPYTDSAYVTVTNNITYNMLSTRKEYCINHGRDTIEVDVAGGTYWTTSGTGIEDAAQGWYNPTQTGLDTIWYGKQGACGDTVFIEVTVNKLDSLEFIAQDTLCSDAGVTQLQLTAGSLSGGAWKDALGGNSYVDATGNFDPNHATTQNGGSFKVYYTTLGDPSGKCPVLDSMMIHTKPRLNAKVTMDTTTFCGTAVAALAKAAQGKGVWTWRGADNPLTVINDSTVSFDPTKIQAANLPQTAYLVYQINDRCGDSDSVQITVSPMEVATIGNPDTTVCVDGGNIALRLDAAAVPAPTPGGTWSGTGVAGSSFDPTGLNGTYKIKYKTPGVCFKEDSFNITVKPRLDATVTMAVTKFCGNATSGTASGAQDGGTWIWRGNGNPLTATPGSKDVTFDPSKVTAPEKAYLVYKIDSLCGDADSVEVTVDQVDIAILVKDTVSFCITDAPQNLDALKDPTSSAGTFTGTGITDGTLGTFDPSSVVTGFYKVMYTTGGNCIAKDSVMVNVVNQMVADFTQDTLKVCEDGTLDVNAYLSAASTKGGGYVSNPLTYVDLNTGVFDVAKATAGNTYKVYYKVAGGTATCADSDSVVVSIIPRENAKITNPDSVAVCQNAGTQNFAAQNAGGTWSLVGGGAAIDANTGVFDPTVSGVGVHKVVYTMNGATGLCPNMDTVIINVLDTPTLNLPAQVDLCGNGSPIVLQKTLKAGFTGSWSGSAGITDANTGAFDPTKASGNVKATFSVTGDCPTQADVNFAIVPIMNPKITNPKDSVCIGDGSYGFTAQDPNGVWSVNNGGQIDPATGSLNLLTSGGGIYTITYTITTTGNGANCPVDSSTTIKITTAGNPTIQAAGPFCENLDAQQLTQTGTGGGTWSSTTAGAVDASGKFYPKNAGQGDHQVTYSLGGLCPIDSTITIKVEGVPVSDAKPDTSARCAPAQFVFTDNSSVTPTKTVWQLSDGTSYTTSNGQNITHIFTNPGDYGLTITNTYANGCVETKNLGDLVKVHAVPVADFKWSPEKVSTLDPSMQFVSTSTNASTFSWNFDRDADPATSTLENQFVRYNIEKGDTFKVCLTVENNGCKDDTCKNVIILDNFTLFAPNAFTPNGDGLNDEFFPVGKDHDNINGADKYQFWIFNRWGEEIFTSTTPYKGWNGTHQLTGKPVQMDVYVWKINVWDEYNGVLKTFYGKVSVIK